MSEVIENTPKTEETVEKVEEKVTEKSEKDATESEKATEDPTSAETNDKSDVAHEKTTEVKNEDPEPTALEQKIIRQVEVGMPMPVRNSVIRLCIIYSYNCNTAN